jgi:nicotinamidase-related amidase
MTDAVLIIDMQEALVGAASAKGKRKSVVQTFDRATNNLMALRDEARLEGVPVFIVQHDGPEGDELVPGSDGWEIVDALKPEANDFLINKKSCDAFHETTLLGQLKETGVSRLVVGRYATQYCVDTSVRSAISHGFDVILVADGNCCSDSPTLKQEAIIAHHNETLDGFHSGLHAVTTMENSAITYQRG